MRKAIEAAKSLAVIMPELAKQWHPQKNGELTPFDVTKGSNKKVWWACSTCNYEWEAMINNRSKGRGCPACAGQVTTKSNNLKSKEPKLAKEWHSTRNGVLTPSDVTSGSGKKVWWKCSNCSHDWEAVIYSRIKGNGCPVCSGRVATADNNLALVNPELAKEWHSIKNENLNPFNVLPSSGIKVWWNCVRGHEWEATIDSRSRGTGCSICVKTKKSSFPEMAIYYYLKQIIDVERQVSLGKKNWPLDLYIPSLKIGVEYDGFFYHQNKENKDESKNDYYQTKGVQIVRIREAGLPPITNTIKNIFLESNNEVGQTNSINELFQFLRKQYSVEQGNVSVNVERDRNQIIKMISEIEESESLFVVNPQLAREWHPDKNHPLTPLQVRANSDIKVWWQCKKGHEWQTTIGNRTRGTGCAICAGQYATGENNLGVHNPLLAQEWHPSKNGEFNPYNILPQSNRNVWWRCSSCNHDWKTTVNNRHKGHGCPACSGRVATADNNLAMVNPNLTFEWHVTKNDRLTPFDVKPKSNRKVWWKCIVCNHEWEAIIADRFSGNGCPKCGRIKRWETRRKLNQKFPKKSD